MMFQMAYEVLLLMAFGDVTGIILVLWFLRQSWRHTAVTKHCSTWRTQTAWWKCWVSMSSLLEVYKLRTVGWHTCLKILWRIKTDDVTIITFSDTTSVMK